MNQTENLASYLRSTRKPMHFGEFDVNRVLDVAVDEGKGYAVDLAQQHGGDSAARITAAVVDHQPTATQPAVTTATTQSAVTATQPTSTRSISPTLLQASKDKRFTSGGNLTTWDMPLMLNRRVRRDVTAPHWYREVETQKAANTSSLTKWIVGGVIATVVIGAGVYYATRD